MSQEHFSLSLTSVHLLNLQIESRPQSVSDYNQSCHVSSFHSLLVFSLLQPMGSIAKVGKFSNVNMLSRC